MPAGHPRDVLAQLVTPWRKPKMLHLKHEENHELPTLTTEIIAAAIAGFEGQKQKIDGQIAELRAILNGTPAAAVEPGKTKRKFSAATLKRMREAQKRRWAKAKGAGEPKMAAQTVAKPKRRLSAAGRKAIVSMR